MVMLLADQNFDFLKCLFCEQIW